MKPTEHIWAPLQSPNDDNILFLGNYKNYDLYYVVPVDFNNCSYVLAQSYKTHEIINLSQFCWSYITSLRHNRFDDVTVSRNAYIPRKLSEELIKEAYYRALENNYIYV